MYFEGSSYEPITAGLFKNCETLEHDDILLRVLDRPTTQWAVR
jgi:hypothetical protein